MPPPLYMQLYHNFHKKPSFNKNYTALHCVEYINYLLTGGGRGGQSVIGLWHPDPSYAQEQQQRK